MTYWYDRDGKALPHTTADEWQHIETLLSDRAYRRVAETTLPDGRWVSTVWLGLNHEFDDVSPPLIFETLVFTSRDDLHDLDCRRYSTEAEAKAGHAEVVAEMLDVKDKTDATNVAGREP